MISRRWRCGKDWKWAKGLGWVKVYVEGWSYLLRKIQQYFVLEDMVPRVEDPRAILCKKWLDKEIRMSWDDFLCRFNLCFGEHIGFNTV